MDIARSDQDTRRDYQPGTGPSAGLVWGPGTPDRPAVAVLQGTGGGGGTPAYKEAPAGDAAGAGKE